MMELAAKGLVVVTLWDAFLGVAFLEGIGVAGKLDRCDASSFVAEADAWWRADARVARGTMTEANWLRRPEDGRTDTITPIRDEEG